MVDVPPDHLRYSPVPDVDAEGLMAPPWVKYPNLPNGSAGWHTEFGQEYWLRFAGWYRAQPAAVRRRFRARYPEPPSWVGVWRGAAGSPWAKWRRPLVAAAVVVGVLAGVGFGIWSDRDMGPPRDELVRRLTADLSVVATPEEAEAVIPGCGTVRLPSGEWVTGVGVNGHSWKRAKDTLVVRDSRGQVRAFVGHVCGPRWMPGYFPPNHPDFPNLDAFYAFLTETGFTEYRPPGP